MENDSSPSDSVRFITDTWLCNFGLLQNKTIDHEWNNIKLTWLDNKKKSSLLTDKFIKFKNYKINQTKQNKKKTHHFLWSKSYFWYVFIIAKIPLEKVLQKKKKLALCVCNIALNWKYLSHIFVKCSKIVIINAWKIHSN